MLREFLVCLINSLPFLRDWL